MKFLLARFEQFDVTRSVNDVAQLGVRPTRHFILDARLTTLQLRAEGKRQICDATPRGIVGVNDVTLDAVRIRGG